MQRELSAQPTEGLFAQYATPFSLEENGVARQKNIGGACAAAVVSASLSLAEQERREDGARQPVVVIVPYPFFPDHGTRICYPGILPPPKGEVDAKRPEGSWQRTEMPPQPKGVPVKPSDFGVLPGFFLHGQKKWGNIAQVSTWENPPRRIRQDRRDNSAAALIFRSGRGTSR